MKKLKSGKIFSELTDTVSQTINQPQYDYRALLIADVHLGGFDETTNRKIEQDFVDLMDYCKHHCNKLVILGDLFDYWMEYPGSRPDIANDAVSAIINLAESGFPVLYITGNHDNWMRSFFRDYGVDIEHEYRMVIWDDHRVLLTHGDGIASSKWNLPRPIIHRFLRNDYFVWLYQRILPEKTGLKLMKGFSKVSSVRPLTSNRQKLDEWCRSLLLQDLADTVICGHHHEVRDEMINEKRYLNTGNFFRDRNLILYANKEFHSVMWDGSKGQLQVTHSAGNP